jgi:tRNA modification GTPase
MLGPRSFTAEDVVEIHTHGGGVCAARVIDACLAGGARLARPGEFSLRAYLNGRLDLSQAESIPELIGARTVAAADSALAGIGGGVGKEVGEIRGECLDILAELDARLDFDEDLPPLDVPGLVHRLEMAKQRVDVALETSQQGRLLRSGLQIAIVGRPNVGKSSLLNALSGTDRAIVTSLAGTTRDVVEASMVLNGGIPVRLLDTAGVREEVNDEVERIGVERSVNAAQGADIVVMVCDGGEGGGEGGVWGAEDEAIFNQIILRKKNKKEDNANNNNSEGKPIPSLLVVNKTDLHNKNSSSTCRVPKHVVQAFSAVVETSASTGTGLEELKQSILKLSGASSIAPGGVSWAVNERQAEALTRAREGLERVVSLAVGGELPVDFWTIDLRSALISLGEVSGEDVTEEVLDTIFSRFCIGK